MSDKRVLFRLCCTLVLAPLVANAQTAPRCEQWPSREFFRAATGADVVACLQAGADVMEIGPSVGATPLHVAAEASADAAVVEVLLAAGAALEGRTSRNPHWPAAYTPLHYAAHNPEVAVLKALLTAGADVDARTWNGWAAIHGATTVAALEVLLAAGADVNARDHSSSTPLHNSARGVRGLLGLEPPGSSTGSAMVEALLAAGADIEARDSQGTPLHGAAGLSNDPAVIAALLAAGAAVDARGDRDRTPLHFAAASTSSAAVLERLLTAGADVHARDRNEDTPLRLAARHNPHPVVIDVLLAAGADMNEGRSPLYDAATNAPAFGALVAAGAEIDAGEPGRRTLLHDVAAGHDAAVVDLLLAAGADVNARDANGQTPLHEAASKSGWRDIGRGVVEDLGMAVVERLLAAGADVNARCNAGWTPLHAAAASARNVAVVEALLAAGADVEARNAGGSAPWDLAFRHRVLPMSWHLPPLFALAGAEAGLPATRGWLREALRVRQRDGWDVRWLQEAIQRGRQRFDGQGVEHHTPSASTVEASGNTRTKPDLPPVGGTSEVFRDCQTCPELVAIPAGRFRMGCVSGSDDCGSDEWPVREVEVAAFALGRYEVTFEEYDRFTEATGRQPLDDGGWGRGRQPVHVAHWTTALAYVDWLSKETGEQYRLPTESEWEYAARAGTTTAFSWGEDVGRNRANCHGCGSRWDDGRTAPVGSFDANAWGLHDVHGNVWEWATGPRGEALRGGSWRNRPRDLRSANRSTPYTWGKAGRNHYGGWRGDRNIGFRVARATVESSSESAATGPRVSGEAPVTPGARIPSQPGATAQTSRVVVGASQGPTVVGKRRCAERQSGVACWEELVDRPGCYFWNDAFNPAMPFSWTGECSLGLAQGAGELQWSEQESPTAPYLFHRGSLRDGRKHGDWVEEGFGGMSGFANEGPYLAGKRHGLWYQDSGGTLVFEGTYVNDRRHGHWVEHDRTFGIVFEGPYVDDKRHGHWIVRDRDGNVTHGPYVNDERHGHWTEYTRGRAEEGAYVEGERHGMWIERDPQLYVEEGPYVEGERHGRWVKRYRDGSVEEAFYVDGYRTKDGTNHR